MTTAQQELAAELAYSKTQARLRAVARKAQQRCRDCGRPIYSLRRTLCPRCAPWKGTGKRAL